MILTAEEQDVALSTLHAAGIRGDDATTSLATLCRLSTSHDLHDWLTQNREATAQALAATYGHEAVRAARALSMHL